jgi:hypothetical protein
MARSPIALPIRLIAVMVFTKIQPKSTVLDALKHWLATDTRAREMTGRIRVEVYVA